MCVKSRESVCVFVWVMRSLRSVVVDEAGTPLGILSLTDLLHITVTATDQK